MAAGSVKLEELAPYLAHLSDDAVQKLNWPRIFENISLILSSHTKGFFDKQQSPDGTPWPKSKGLGVYALDQAARGNIGSHRSLQDTGRLYGSITGRPGKDTVYDVRGTLMEWGTNVEYGPLMHFGGTITPKTAKALAIPLTKEASRVDGPRQFSRDLQLVWPKGYSHGWLVEETDDKKTVMHYLLVPKAVVPPRPFVGINDDILMDIQAYLGDELEKTLMEL